MKKEDLLRAFGDIDESFIDEASADNRRKAKMPWSYWVGLAAAVCVIGTVGIITVQTYSSKSSSTSLSMDNELSVLTEETAAGEAPAGEQHEEQLEEQPMVEDGEVIITEPETKKDAAVDFESGYVSSNLQAAAETAPEGEENLPVNGQYGHDGASSEKNGEKAEAEGINAASESADESEFPEEVIEGEGEEIIEESAELTTETAAEIIIDETTVCQTSAAEKPLVPDFTNGLMYANLQLLAEAYRPEGSETIYVMAAMSPISGTSVTNISFKMFGGQQLTEGIQSSDDHWPQMLSDTDLYVVLYEFDAVDLSGKSYQFLFTDSDGYSSGGDYDLSLLDIHSEASETMKQLLSMAGVSE